MKSLVVLGLLPLLAFVAGCGDREEASVPELRDGNEVLAALGEFLFREPRLSQNGKIACADCHDPERFFTDGRAVPVGIKGPAVGAHSANLFGLGHRDAFPPAPMVVGNRITVVDGGTLSLAQRCLAPMTNPVEMGSQTDSALDTLSDDPMVRVRFAAAFEDPEVTEDRIGEALAAYVRTIEPPPSPYRDYLGGASEALDDSELRGLAVFEGRGECARCHSGAALTDGLMHLVLLPENERARRARLHQPVRMVGYGAPGNLRVPTLTPSLWAVGRTAPYFRDGSVKSLAEAVSLHVRELRQVHGLVARGDLGKDPAILEIDAPGDLKPKTPVPAPEDLGPSELRDLLAFLETLAPRGD